MNNMSAPHRPTPERHAYKLADSQPSTNSKSPKYHNRGYLPHYEDPRILQSLTFRTADSLPADKLAKLEERLRCLPLNEQAAKKRRQIESWLDAGYGHCPLAHPAVAKTLKESLLRFHGSRYELVEWCIMPNHVHVLLHPHAPLSKIVQSWKSYTGRWTIERWEELGFSGDKPNQLWMPDYWDRFIRNGEHLNNVVRYIRSNPEKAGLTNWPWSSARE